MDPNVKAMLARVANASNTPPMQRIADLQQEEVTEAQRIAAEHDVDRLGVALADLHVRRAELSAEMVAAATRYHEMEQERVTLDRTIRVAAAAVAHRFELARQKKQT